MLTWTFGNWFKQSSKYRWNPVRVPTHNDDDDDGIEITKRQLQQDQPQIAVEGVDDTDNVDEDIVVDNDGIASYEDEVAAENVDATHDGEIADNQLEPEPEKNKQYTAHIRLQQLDKTLEECRQVHQHYKDLDLWMINQRLHAQKQLQELRTTQASKSEKSVTQQSHQQQMQEVQELDEILPDSPKTTRKTRAQTKKQILEMFTSQRKKLQSSTTDDLLDDDVRDDDKDDDRLSFTSSDWDPSHNEPYSEDDSVYPHEDRAGLNQSFYSPALNLDLLEDYVQPGRVYDVTDRLHHGPDHSEEEGGRHTQ